MAVEIERKYIVIGDFKKYVSRSYEIIQAYLITIPEKTVRIRIMGDKAFITIKGIQTGLSRYEWEKEIEIPDARELMDMCGHAVIEKTRYLVSYKDQLIEVDEFSGKNEGLLIAEIELESEAIIPDLPEWIGEEISEDTRYQNVNLAVNPFMNWQ